MVRPPRPSWLETDWIVAAFAKPKSNTQIAYHLFVTQSKNRSSHWKDLKNQFYLGSEALFEACRSGGYSMGPIGGHVGLHYSRISRIIGFAEKALYRT